VSAGREEKRYWNFAELVPVLGVWQTEVKRRLVSLSKIQVRVSCSNIAALIMAACFENLVSRILLPQTTRTIV